MIVQLSDYVLAQGTVIYDADKCGSLFYIGYIFHNIAAYTAMNIFYMSNISSIGYIDIIWESLNIYKYRTKNNYSHTKPHF